MLLLKSIIKMLIRYHCFPVYSYLFLGIRGASVVIRTFVAAPRSMCRWVVFSVLSLWRLCCGSVVSNKCVVQKGEREVGRIAERIGVIGASLMFFSLYPITTPLCLFPLL